MTRRLCLLLMIILLPAAALADYYAPGEHLCDAPDCFWELNMDISDTESIWAMLTAPMTVLEGDHRAQKYVYAEPDEDSERIGEVTCTTQGVHVLESYDDGWSLIETYSSSFFGSRVKAWNQLVTGYVKTELLKTVDVDQEWGLVVDKFTQRLYVFHEGEMIEELLVSTGYGTSSEPYNETRSGEYLLYSRSGEFPSGNLSCSYGIRYNDGDLIHEVPHKKHYDELGNLERVSYYHCEPYLGEKASHGCIRVQRLKTEKGVNMEWLWDNLYSHVGNIRMVIWEDWPGRLMEYPEDDLVLYYNPEGGSKYHAAEECEGVKRQYLPLSPFTYGQIEEEDFIDLVPCEYCVPVRRTEAIDDLNWNSLE